MKFKSKDISFQGFDNLTRREKIIFLAGVFDGEGTFGCYPSGSVKYRKNYLIVAVEATDIDMVTRFNEIFPGGNVYPVKRRQEHHKYCFRWKINGEKAWPVLAEMIPYMCKRRRDKYYGLVESYRNGFQGGLSHISESSKDKDVNVRCSNASRREDGQRRERISR